MKAYNYNDELSDENVDKLFNFINMQTPDEEIIIYFSSNGGSTINSKIVCDFINRNHPERFTFFVNWECSSSAFFMLPDLECKIFIDKSAFAVVHIISREDNTAKLLDDTSHVYYLNQRVKNDNKKLIAEWSLCGFTDEEIIRIQQGKDVVLGATRMQLIMDAIKELRKETK